MALYEHVFIVRQDVGTGQVEALTEQYTNIINELGGKVEKTEYWGLKSMAYRIKKNRKGHYTLMNIDAPSAAVKEVERQQSISDDVIRNLTVKVDELEEEPSAMMRAKGRDDRGPRGPRPPFRDDNRGTPPVADGDKKPEVADGDKKPEAADGDKKPEAADSDKKPEATDGDKKPNVADSPKKADDAGEKQPAATDAPDTATETDTDKTQED